MPVVLKYIELENFKSYKGFRKLGPLKNFMAVIGPNGSGKSNFMDAISFVMGEKTSSLRVRKLADLIHGASIGRAVSSRASVSAIFSLEDGDEKTFTRSIIGSSAEHRINGDVVSSSAYLKELELIGINVNAKNFLVFQGAVENIAMKNPKERTALFEEISGSGALKKEYDRLKEEMMQAEENTQFSYQKKKNITMERKEAKLEKEEAEKYKKLQDNLADRQVELQLFKLFHNERQIRENGDEVAARRKDIDKIEKKKGAAEEKLKEVKKDQGKSQREFAKVDADIREKENAIQRKRPAFIKAKEKATHLNKKVEQAKKSLKQAQKAYNSHKTDVEELVTEAGAAERRKKEYEEMTASESKEQGRNLQLEGTQIKEYQKLKEKAAKESARYMSELDSTNREHKSVQDRLDTEVRKKEEIEGKLKTKGHEYEEAQKRLEKLSEHIKGSQAQLEEQQKVFDDLQGDVGCSKERIQELQQDLENVTGELGDARVDKHEDTRRKKKQDLVDNFKRVFPGVYDRLINMSQPIHKKYNVAITKQLGRYMEAIVVDSESTARECIRYLKDQMLEPETFLPLDYIQAKPLKERLRNITNPKGVKLLYDVLRYDPPEIKKAILFVTNNSLVCETPDDAMKAAYEMEDGQRYDAVALDGTFYQKSGIISGGSVDLAKKAKRWDDKQVSTLKGKKEKLAEELRQAMKNSRKESEIQTIKSQINGLKTRLRYSQNDKDTTKKKIDTLSTAVEKMRTNLESYEPTIRDIERDLKVRAAEIEETKSSMNTVEDRIFSRFCSQIGVSNIRQYEERELKTQQDREKKKMELENQTNRIGNQLEYEKRREEQLLTNVQKFERTVQDDEDALETSKKIETVQMGEIDTDMKDVDKLKQTKSFLKGQLDKLEEDVNYARKDVGTVAKELQSANKAINQLEASIEQERAQRHSLLMQCKMDNIDIPFKTGSLDELDEQGDDESMEMSSSQPSHIIYEKEAAIEIDYNTLEEGLTEIDDNDDVRKVEKTLEKQISELQATITRIQAPNMRAMQKLDEAREKLEETNKEFDNARRKAKQAKMAFERAKQERHDLFMKCFDHVSNIIDDIYKALTRNQSAQAFLGPENPEEPYLEGINYNCVAPGKRFQPMLNLSGGEKTIAALALLFGIHSFHPAPFFVLDEIDAALDNTNIGKVASYIESRASNSEDSMNVIVISLKDEFYSHADGLIGVCPDRDAMGEHADCLVSKVLTLDLTGFPKDAAQG